MLDQAHKLIDDRQYVAAIALLTKILAENPKNEDALWMRAVTLVRMGQARDAVADVKALIELTPNQLSYILTLGDIYALDGQMEKAIEVYYSLLTQKPEAGNVVLRLGNLLQIEKRWEEAFTIYSNAIETIPDFAEAYMARGAVKHHLKDLAGAAEDLKKALTLKPELAEEIEGSMATIDKKGCH